MNQGVFDRLSNQSEKKYIASITQIASTDPDFSLVDYKEFKKLKECYTDMDRRIKNVERLCDDYAIKKLTDEKNITIPIISMTEVKFNRLAEKWRNETAYASSLFEISMNENYQYIIGMGRNAIPFILRELLKKTEHWFWALKAITCEDPVSDKDRGDLVRMTGAWLNWVAINGYEL